MVTDNATAGATGGRGPGGAGFAVVVGMVVIFLVLVGVAVVALTRLEPPAGDGSEADGMVAAVAPAPSGVPPPLTRAAVDAMDDRATMAAMMAISRARKKLASPDGDEAIDARLRDDFRLVLERRKALIAGGRVSLPDAPPDEPDPAEVAIVVPSAAEIDALSDAELLDRLHRLEGAPDDAAAIMREALARALRDRGREALIPRRSISRDRAEVEIPEPLTERAVARMDDAETMLAMQRISKARKLAKTTGDEALDARLREDFKLILERRKQIIQEKRGAERAVREAGTD